MRHRHREPRTAPPLRLESRLKMATSSERSPPPFPDSEDQDVLDSEDVQRDSDEDDLFMSAVSPEVVAFRATLEGAVPGRQELASASGEC